MKKLSLLPLLLCLLCGFARAATVSGTVTFSTTSLPVSGQKVYVMDTFSMWRDSAITNSSGAYSVTVPSSLPTPAPMLMYATACGVYQSNKAMYTGSNLTWNFSVCAGTGVTVHGVVSLGSVANNGVAKVYLIRKTWDSTAGGSVLTAIDSTLTASTGGTYSILRPTQPADTLLLKAALMPSHPLYSSYLPTYYTSSLVWSSATMLTATNFAPATATNITMSGGTNPGGAGFIGGSVLVGANKNAGVGDPLSGRMLLLTNAAGQGVAYTTSNASGQFQFSNLPTGTYKIFGDIWGKANPALTVTLSATKTSVTNIIFEENNKKFEGKMGNVGVGTVNALAGVNVFPNPATDFVNVNGLSAINGDKNIVLSNITGTVVSRQVISKGDARVSTAELPAGVYLLQVQTEGGNASFKVVK